MAFQFYCPQRHLLEAAEAQAGQQSQCPVCGTIFMIPPPPAAAPVSPAITPPPRQGPPPLQPSAPSTVFRDAPAPATSTAQIDPIAAMRGAVERSTPAAAAPAPPEPREELVHLFCPNGHELETPTDMLGQDALCPHCRAQFRLRMRDTREFKAEQLRKEQEFNRKALRWAIATAAIVGLGLLAMALYTVAG